MDKPASDWIWEGVDAAVDVLAALQPRWTVPETVAITADLGHFLNAEQVARDASSCVEAGSCAVHLHIRDECGRETGNLSAWREVINRIRARCGRIVIDTGVRGRTPASHLRFISEGFADLLGIAPHRQPSYIQQLLLAVRESNAKPQIIAWDTSDILLGQQLLQGEDNGMLHRPSTWLLVPGAAYRGMPMIDSRTMAYGLLYAVDLVKSTDPNAVIVVSASGRASTYLTCLAMLLGCHVRVGLGETPWRFPHTDDLIQSTTDSVREAVQLGALLGRRPASATEYRRLLHLAG